MYCTLTIRNNVWRNSTNDSGVKKGRKSFPFQTRSHNFYSCEIHGFAYFSFWPVFLLFPFKDYLCKVHLWKFLTLRSQFNIIKWFFQLVTRISYSLQFFFRFIVFAGFFADFRTKHTYFKFSEFYFRLNEKL